MLCRFCVCCIVLGLFVCYLNGFVVVNYSLMLVVMMKVLLSMLISRNILFCSGFISFGWCVVVLRYLLLSRFMLRYELIVLRLIMWLMLSGRRLMLFMMWFLGVERLC